MTDTVHVTRSAGLPAANVSAVSISELVALIGTSLPTEDPLTVGALWNDGGIVKTSPIPLAVSDFKNGVYLLDGVSKTLTDLWPDITGLTLTPGAGLELGYTGTASASATIEGTAGLTTAINPQVGHTAVIDVDLVHDPLDDAAFWTEVFLTAKNAGNTYQNGVNIVKATSGGDHDEYNAKQRDAGVNSGEAIVTPVINGFSRVAVTYTAARIYISVNGGAVVSAVPTAPHLADLTGTMQLFMNTGPAAHGAMSRIRCAKFYPPIMDVTQLQILSA